MLFSMQQDTLNLIYLLENHIKKVILACKKTNNEIRQNNELFDAGGFLTRALTGNITSISISLNPDYITAYPPSRVLGCAMHVTLSTLHVTLSTCSSTEGWF